MKKFFGEGCAGDIHIGTLLDLCENILGDMHKDLGNL